MNDWTRCWGTRLRARATRGGWVLASTLLLACGGGGGGSGDDGQGTEGSESSGPSGADTSGSEESSGGGGETEDTEVVTDMLSPTEHLVRVSMALRGTRPSLQDLEAVEADPDAVEALVDGYLDSPAFGVTVRNLHNEALLVEPDYAYYPAGFPNIGPLQGRDFYEINRDVMQAPLRLVEHVVMSDLPYHEVVTGEYTLANDTVATIWDIPYEGDGDWEVTAWSDGRDNAGVLSDSWLFQRHRSTDANANRGRANLVASAFLCADFTSTDVDVDVSVDLSDPEAVADAVLENPSCAACHVQLDPLASYFRGFFPLYVPQEQEEEDDPYPMELPWLQELFPELLGVPMLPPSYFGEEGDGLAFLGQRIAEDPRFSRCTVRRFWSYLHQTDLDAVPDAVLDDLDADFAGSMDAKALTKQIVLSDAFRTAAVVPSDDGAPTEDEADLGARVGLLKARPQALGSMMQDLTGFRWVADFSTIIDEETGEPVNLGRVPLLEDSFLGYRVLGGGIDSMFVTQPAHTYSAPNLLVLRTLAREAAHYEVEQGLEGQGRLLTVSPDTTGESEVRQALVALHRRLYAEVVEPDSAAIDQDWALFSAALQAGGEPGRAWKTTLVVLLSDLRVAFY